MEDKKICPLSDKPGCRDLYLVLKTQRDTESRMINKITIDISLPDGFPDKYKNAVRQAADLCAVKKHILNAPEFEITIS